jgi:hypothetical protein
MRRGTDAQGFEILALHMIGAFPPNHANGFPPVPFWHSFISSSAPVSSETHRQEMGGEGNVIRSGRLKRSVCSFNCYTCAHFPRCSTDIVAETGNYYEASCLWCNRSLWKACHRKGVGNWPRGNCLCSQSVEATSRIRFPSQGICLFESSTRPVID